MNERSEFISKHVELVAPKGRSLIVADRREAR